MSIEWSKPIPVMDINVANTITANFACFEPLSLLKETQLGEWFSMKLNLLEELKVTSCCKESHDKGNYWIHNDDEKKEATHILEKVSD